MTVFLRNASSHIWSLDKASIFYNSFQASCWSIWRDLTVGLQMFTWTAVSTCSSSHSPFVLELFTFKHYKWYSIYISVILFSYWEYGLHISLFSVLFMPKDKDKSWLHRSVNMASFSLLWRMRSVWPLLSWELATRIFLNRVGPDGMLGQRHVWISIGLSTWN